MGSRMGKQSDSVNQVDAYQWQSSSFSNETKKKEKENATQGSPSELAVYF